MVLKTDGSVWVTGGNYFGQLGDHTNTDRHSFVKVISGGVKAIFASSGHSMVLKNDGSVWGTGNNQFGQLGDGSLVNTN